MDPPPPPPSPSRRRHHHAASMGKKRKFERVHDGGSAGLDLINALPDAVLCTIISLLPTKEGARTQAIARRWRPLWRCAPLNPVADYGLSCKERKRRVIISKILAEHPGPALLLELPNIGQRDHDKLDGWLRSQALTDLQTLCLGYSADDKDKPQAAHHLGLVRAISDLPTPQAAHHLRGHRHGGRSAQHDLWLFLEGNLGVARLCISSLTLRSIGFSAIRWRAGVYEWNSHVQLQELLIEDAPCLERLLPLYPDFGLATVRVIQAPKLQVLGVLSKHISKLHIGTMVFQEMIPISVTTTMPTMKVLAIESDGPNLDALIGLLKCFPCLERLYVIFDPWSRRKMKSVHKHDTEDPIECLESYLKRVVLEGYSGDMPDVEFAKMFVLNAKVLEEMKFGSIHSRDHEWKSNQHMWLQVDSRASQDARFEFTSRYCRYNHIDNSDIHDLSMADPFKCFDAPCKVSIQECLFCGSK